MAKKNIISANLLNTLRLQLYGIDKKTIAIGSKLSIPPVTDLLLNGIASDETYEKVKAYANSLPKTNTRQKVA